MTNITGNKTTKSNNIANAAIRAWNDLCLGVGSAMASLRGKAPQAAVSKSFRRRPSVERAVYEQRAVSRRTEKPERYLRGIAAAEMFELAGSERAAVQELKQAKVKRGFFARHWKGIVAMVLVAALLGGGFFYLRGLYFSDEVFITDTEQTGNITIADRLTTTKEQAEKVSYFLLLGVDDSSLLTDCIWILCFDHAAHKMNVMQVPRDTYVGFTDSPGTAKINGVFANPKTVKWCETCSCSPAEEERSNGIHTVCGTELISKKESNVSALIRVINTRLGLPIDHFVIFNFRGFAKIVDTIGGVDIHLDRGIHDGAITLSAGDHHLTGWQAVDYMRHRKSYSEGDVGRVSAQRIMVNALMNKAFAMDVSTMLDVLMTCANNECFQTDLSIAEIKDYALDARKMDTSKLEMFTMPGYDHWVRPNPSYYCCDESKTAQLINEKLLPYGLPDGSMSSVELIDFPSVNDRLSPNEGSNRTTTDSRTTTTTRTTENNGGEYEPPVIVDPSETTHTPTVGTTTTTAAPTTPAPTTTTTAAVIIVVPEG